MADEIINAKNGSTEPEETIPDAFEQLQELKKNSVDKNEYDRLKADYNKMFKQVVENRGISESPKVEEKHEDIDVLVKRAFAKGQSNLEYVKNNLALRKELMRLGAEDPYLPHSSKRPVTAEDRAAVERVVAAFEHCVEYAEGDSEVFTNELMRLTKDSAPKFARR